jgi:hypothetical protein
LAASAVTGITVTPPTAAAAAPHLAAAVGLAAPAVQIGHAAQMHLAAGGAGPLTIRLEPAELGALQIKIERGTAGAATVTVAVERPETLHLLQGDLAHLHQALDRAGVPTEQRSLTLALAPPPPSGGTGGSAGGFGQGSGFAGSGNRQGNTAGPITTADTGPEETLPDGWLRAGLNITA